MLLHIFLFTSIAVTLLCGAGFLNRDAVANNAAPHSCLSFEQSQLVFEEEFESLDVSPVGPGSKWIAHTPWNGDFGDAVFADPGPDFPFTLEGGNLRIEARKIENGQWFSGLLASANGDGSGFSQKYGYFEIRAKLPEGPGLWPAFWLNSVADTAAQASVEIDVLEHYGHFPSKYISTVQVWSKEGANRAEAYTFSVDAGALYRNFNTYGVLVGPEWTIFYHNRIEYWRSRTPIEHNRPLLILLNLALGSGWSIEATPSPSYMYVDYVRVYAANDEYFVASPAVASVICK